MNIRWETKAISYLARREYSHDELAAKLWQWYRRSHNKTKAHASEQTTISHTISDSDIQQEIEQALKNLTQLGYLSNARYCEHFIRSHSHWGSERILMTLEQKVGDIPDLETVSEQLRATESDRLLAVWQKRFHEKPTSPQTYAKQVRFLVGRGFKVSDITRFLGTIPQHDDSKFNPFESNES